MTMQNNPPITVLMSVHNGEAYLAEAVESVISQSYPHFLFLLVDDASTDATPDILSRYAAQDKRINIMTNENNLGLAASLNKGLEQINTPYVARMDADDVSLPERLERQLAYIEAHPEVAALGTWVDPINETGTQTESHWFTHIRQYLNGADVCKALLLGHSVLVHPTVMLRTHNVQAIGGYRPCFRYAQDYDLWLRLLPECELAVLPEVLLRYRMYGQDISTGKVYEQSIANVCALSTAVIRERGEADPLQNRVKALDYDAMHQLADAAGAIAWLHWLDINAHGGTKIWYDDVCKIKQRIRNVDWYDPTIRRKNQHIRASDLWLSKIILLQQQIETQKQQIIECNKIINNSKLRYIKKRYADLYNFWRAYIWRRKT